MKTILLTILLATITITTTYSAIPSTYEIRGSISGLRDNAKVQLFSWSRDAIIDSSYTVNEQFLLKGSLIEVPELLSLQIEQEGKILERKLLIAHETVEIIIEN